MKYNININQKALSKYDIDLKDMAIFDYIHVMCASVNKNIEKERFKGHTWINYERLIEDMPALRIKSRNTISARITSLEKAGLITTEKKMVKGHRRVFVKMTTQSDSVFVESSERVLSDEKRVRETVQDNYTKDNYTKDNIAETSSAEDSPKEIKPFFWKKYLDTMFDSKHDHVQVIAYYFKERGTTFDTLAEAQAGIRRHLRPAKEVAVFSEEKIKTATAIARAKFPEEWTIETIMKYLTK